MRPRMAIAFVLLILQNLALQAAPLNMTGTTFSFGYWDECTNRNGVRVAPRWDWGVDWMPNWPIQFTGYWEVGAWYVTNNQTKAGQNTHLYIFSGSPILQIWLGPYDMKRNALFFEIGVGPAYLTESSLGNANLGSHWQFEDKFGVGLNFDTQRPVQLIYRYYHYSNAGLKEPNRGLDLHSFAVVWFF